MGNDISHLRHPKGLCIVSDDKKFIYVPIPKCASSSLCFYFRENYNVFETIYQNLNESQKYYLTFTFIRNPIDRFISAYNTISLRNLSDLKDKVFTSIKINEQSSNKEKLYRFLSFIDSVKINKWDEHILEQESFIRGITFDYIGKVENSKKDFVKLMKMIDYNNYIKLPFQNKTKNNSCFHIDQKIISYETMNTIYALYKNDFDLTSRYIKRPGE